MLVLTRAVGESIILSTSDGQIEIKYLENYQSGKAKVGISAPLSVNVVRKEIMNRGKEVNGNR